MSRTPAGPENPACRGACPACGIQPFGTKGFEKTWGHLWPWMLSSLYFYVNKVMKCAKKRQKCQGGAGRRVKRIEIGGKKPMFSLPQGAFNVKNATITHMNGSCVIRMHALHGLAKRSFRCPQGDFLSACRGLTEKGLTSMTMHTFTMRQLLEAGVHF